MKHIGDITKINGKLIDPVDVITCGSPCQDLSVAGLRAGLAGERSGLFMEQIRIIKEMREVTNGKQPRFMVWENVPGAFSSNKGEDFRAVLEETARIADQDAVIPGPPKGKWTPAGCIMADGWSIAWRVHDAQFWGVPQRRKRIALVADFGGECAPEILFEREGMSGDTEESGKERKGTAEDIGAGVEKTSRSIVYGIGGYNSEGMKSSNPHSGIYEADTSRTLDLNGGNPACNQGGMMVVCATTEMTPKIDEDGVSFSLRSRDYKDPQVGCIEGNDSRPSHRGDGYVESETMYTLNNTERHAVCKEEPTMIEMTSTKNTIVEDGISPTLTARMGTGGNQVNAVCVGNGQLNQISMAEQANTLDTMHDQQAIMTFGIDRAAFCAAVDVRNGRENVNINGILQAKDNGGWNANSNTILRHGFVVRRLTPLECERLQGFPDGWTNIGDWVDSKGKKHKGDADSPRYKALGNSIALPFWKWMAERMVRYIPERATMGSLFDGIGGFPLAFSECGVAPVWASEIEEFCIAVTNKRFNEV